MKTLVTWILLLFAVSLQAQITVVQSVYFDLDDYSIRKDQAQELEELFDKLLYKEILEVRILGYCDDRGSIEYNKTLSENRVRSVASWLHAHEINTNLIFAHIEGLGEVALVKSNIPAEVAQTRARNRRVDIMFKLPEQVANRLEIKTIDRTTLTSKEAKYIDAYEDKVVDRVLKKFNSSQPITIEETDTYLEIPTSIEPKNKDYEEPFKSLLRRDIEVGETINLDKILFLKGRSTINPGSIPKLRRVIEIMIARKDLHFEIRGHVCCIHPRFPDALDRNSMRSDLSQARARLIFQLMWENGVEKRRMSYKGYGRTAPLGRTDKEDRRVEFYITKIGD